MMNEFKVYAELNKFIELCGGEDTIRWIAKCTGSENWETTKIHPIIAWNDKYIESPLIVGIAIRVNDKYQIIASIENFKNINFKEWIGEISNNEKYFDIASGLLDNNNAIIASEMDIIDGEILGWNYVINQVIDGNRSNGLHKIENKDNKNEFDMDLKEFDSLVDYFEVGNVFNNFLKLLEDSLKKSNIPLVYDTEEDDMGFGEKFKEDWA
jgi:hypothetical protein